MSPDDRFDTSGWPLEENINAMPPRQSISHGAGHLNSNHDDISQGADEGWDGIDVDEGSATGGSAKGKEKERIVKPFTKEALEAFEAAQQRAGIIYVSRIPPGMRAQKIRQLLSAYGEVGRMRMVTEEKRRTENRRKFTGSKTVNFVEGWVEFADKHVARSVATLLNGQPIGGRNRSRYKDEVWTMKYLPKFKWNMLTEHLAQGRAERTARLRIELAQSKLEQADYLKQVALAKTLEQRSKKKRKEPDETMGGRWQSWSNVHEGPRPRPRVETVSEEKVDRGRQLKEVLDKIF
ncbi:RNA-binding ATPase activator esf2 [Tulasnella sp. 403]|nr:RNA-binding ATPase activator esf2 [Tulasnella sp. 403]